MRLGQFGKVVWRGFSLAVVLGLVLAIWLQN